MGWKCSDEGVYYKSELREEIRKGEFRPNEKEYVWENHIDYTYGRSFAKLYAAIQGDNNVKQYKKLLKKWDNSEIFKLNLYPIAFDSTDETLWQQYGLDKTTGLDEKHLFQTWCFMNRFPAFANLRKNHPPKLIIGTGVSYLRDFLVCFGGDDKNSALIRYGDIKPVSKTNKQNMRRYYWVKIDNRTTLVVIPFFSGSYGLNSDYLLQEMGNRIREILKPDSIE